MKFNIFEKAKEKIIVVAHRGTFAGNIPCNTLPAFKAAVASGADMIEVDVDISKDGTLYIFHPYMESPFLGTKERIRTLSDEDISKLRYINYDNTPTQFGLNTFEEILEEFNGKCYINVDKFWSDPEKIWKAIKRHGMEEQVLVKSAYNEKVISVLKSIAPEAAFMPIVSSDAAAVHNTLLKSGINYVGAECLFYTDDDYSCSLEFIDKLHSAGKLAWANSIIYDHRQQIAANHSDDTSICGNPDDGWGWLAKRGFDFIQTDWVSLMTKYLDANGLLYKK